VNKETLITAFAQLGKAMVQLGKQEPWTDFSLGLTEEEYEKLQIVINRQIHFNGWFSKKSVCDSLLALGNQLSVESLTDWTSKYTYTENPKRVGVIMAGNLPLVGFHDFLCVLLSGHYIVAKMSSDDKTLLPALTELLVKFAPEIQSRITLTENRIGEIDAMIATGSNNSMRYFESYFGKYPHIFRKNRTSMAIFDGSETEEQIHELGKDIFTYFGLGCRNVSQILIPADFDINRFFGGIINYSEVVNHHKYANNYDYNKAIHLMNQENILDNGFILLKESDELHSPLAMLFYHRYENQTEVEKYIEKQKENLQVIVGNQYVPFGQAQCPMLSDYADGIDTMKWLDELK
jgi:hypothetical protein